MAIKLFQEPIDKRHDWGGDDRTNGLPVSGERVQEFIKNTLNSKFGALYYDRTPITGFEDHTGTNQYLIFSDTEDKETWESNPVEYASLVLARFDAPAPATIVISGQSKQVNTVLLSAIQDQKIEFNYLIKDSSDREQLSRMSINVSVNNNISGVVTAPTQVIGMGKDPTQPIHWEFKDLGDYLSEGTNTVSITLTSLEYNVSTTIIFQYRVLNLILSSTFADSAANFYYYRGISLDANDYFGTTLTAQGTGAKYLRVFIDGKNIYGDETASQFIGSSTPQNYDLFISFAEGGEMKSWAIPGKHNIQFYFFVLNEASEEIKSQTLYYDFVLTQSGMTRGSFILFSRELEQGALVNPGDRIKINTEQYESMSLNYAAYDTALQPGSEIIVNRSFIDKTTEELIDDPNASGVTTIASSSTATLDFTFQTYGNMELQLQSQLTGNNKGEKVYVDVEVAKSSVEINEVDSGLILKLSALNRSNSEPVDTRNTWEYVYHIPNTEYTQTTTATFNNVLWNSQNGWLDNCLVLNNGATVTIPMNIFGQFNAGVTFEIDFETSNVQDDEALIMTYGETNTKGELVTPGIQIKACSALLRSNSGNTIKTNYKDGSRQKIQFIFNGNSEAAETSESPYLMYLVVNGVLDRAAQFLSTDSVGENTPGEFTIGNMDGKATIKIHSIRVYRRALTLDECVNNYIADSKQIRKNYLKNDIYSSGSNISMDKILNGDINVPVMVIYGDVMESIVQLFDKKSNVPVDILYRDPKDSQFNFFAHDCWMSNQGTSSMNYPRRNFRLYFNKNVDNKSMRGHAPAESYLYRTYVYQGLIDETIISQIQQGQIDDLGNIEGYTAWTNKKWQEDDGSINKKKYTNCYLIPDMKMARRMWHSGIDLFEKVFDSETGKTSYKKLKNLSKAIKDGKEIYGYGAWTHFKEKDLYTDRWTIKCDYAESSMTHNAGVGRLWGDVMKNVTVPTGGFSYNTQGERFTTNTPCRTNAQQAAINQTLATGEEYGDIRTSCDGTPIVVFNRTRIKDSEGNYTGTFNDPVFLGLYNIMTDKGSTPLFGFEDLRDDEGTNIFDASHTECWECLQNGSNLAQMNDITTDDTDGSEVGYSEEGSDNEGRPLFATYEARWPDNDDLNDTLTNNLETLIRFVNSCKDAVKVTVDGKDGYTLSDFTQIEQSQAAELSELVNEPQRATEVIENLTNWNGKLYIGVPQTSYKNGTEKFYVTDDNGEVIYNEDETPKVIDPTTEEGAAAYKKLIEKNKMYYRQVYAVQNVTGIAMEEIFKSTDTLQVKIQAVYAQLTSSRPYVYTASEDDSQLDYVEQMYDDSLGFPWFILDNTYDRTKVVKEINTEKLKDDIYVGQVYTFDGKRVNSNGDQVNPNAWVTVYLKRNGNNYTYKNEFGEDGEVFNQGLSLNGVITEVCSGNVGTTGESFKGKTLMDYWKDKKYEHFDVWKLAAYYVYVMRFAGVDQVIKNTMLTTEDGKHYYYINYDNDTVLGVRNDGFLAYDWKIDRNTYDDSIGSYAFAGFGSVLFNLLEADSDFMDKVQQVANAMVTSGVLTYDIALDMFNNKQAGTWSERLYNNSEMFKYIGIWKDIDNIGKETYNPFSNDKYLPFLQGARTSHREWWLRHRFDLYDSKWSAGEYSLNNIRVYESATASSSVHKNIFKMVSGSKFYYTVQTNGRTLGNLFVELENDEKWIPETSSPLAIGDPMTILGASNIKELDFSEQRDQLGISLEFRWPDTMTSRLKKLIIGGDKPTSGADAQNACSLGSIVGLYKCSSLEELDIRTANRLSPSPDISGLGALKVFLAEGSNITTFIPSRGLNLERVSLPDTIQTIKLDTCTLSGEFKYTPNSNLRSFEFINCEGINIINFVNEWYKSLIIDGARRSNYSCKLSFEKIDLPQYIGPEDAEIATDVDDWKQSLSSTPKKIESLAWLNEIRTGLGNNTNGEPNFNIEGGVIKLYGHGENGGLTEEDYSEMISIWPADFFEATNAAHFDANKSIFITVTSPGNHMSYNEVSGAYDIVSGQTLEISATIFPASNERVITFIPRFLNQSNRWQVWNTGSNGSYYYNYNQGVQRSVLTNELSKGVLKTAEYTNGTEKLARIIVNDSLATDAENAQNVVLVNILDVIKPERLLIKNTEGADITSRSQTIDTTEEHIYELQFSNQEEVNVDIKSVNAYFNETNESEGEFGTLRGFIDEETGKVLIGYTPIINSITSAFRITPTIILNDEYSTKITAMLPISLQTKKINEITLSYNGDPIEKEENGEYNLVNYITTLNNQSTIEYRYNINLNPNDYNVKIKSMSIDLSGGITSNCTIQDADPDVTGVIPYFTLIARTASKKSFLDLGDITINIVDEFDNEISQVVNFEVGCFYPDSIKLIKTELVDGSLLPTTDRDINIDLLNGENKSVDYNIHVYSVINGQYWVWGDEDDVVSEVYNNEQTPHHFLSVHPSLVGINATIRSNDEDDALQYTDIMLATTPVGNSFTLQSDPSKSQFNTRNIKVSYPVTFNGKTKDVDNSEFYVSRSSALAVNGNWQNLEVGGYFMDRNKKFYDIVGLSDVLNNYETAQDGIVCICWVYENSNATKTIITLDPWKLNEDNTYWWYTREGSFYRSTSTFMNGGSVMSLASGYASGDVNNYSRTPIEIFRAMYKYYKFKCAQTNASDPDNDGGQFYFTNDRGVSDEHQLAINVADGTTSLNGEVETSFPGGLYSLFTIYNYYNNTYPGIDLEGRILSNDEIIEIMNHTTEIGTLLDTLDGSHTLKNKLFDKEVYYLDSEAEDVNRHAIPDSSSVIGTGVSNDAKNYKYQKIFWVDRLSETSEMILPSVWVYYDRQDAVTKMKFIDASNMPFYMSGSMKAYCLFGPQL